MSEEYPSIPADPNRYGHRGDVNYSDPLVQKKYFGYMPFSLEKARNAPATLCNNCKEMTSVLTNIQQLTSDSGYGHLSWDNIEYFAERGCRLCLLIYENTENSSAKSMETDLSMGYFHAQKRKQSDGKVAGDFDFGCLMWKQDLFVTTTLSVSADHDDPAAKWILQRPWDNDVASQKSIELAQNWLHECLHCHEESSGSEAPQLPTRVIDVGKKGDLDVKLYASRPDERAKYIALSYCWGKVPFLTTKKETKDEHFKVMPHSKMPPTFRDAIRMTQELGIRYLWIDALCIIQDDPEDVAKEMTTMRGIYKHATLTITISTGDGVTKGFLNPRPSPTKVKLPFLCPDEALGSIWLSAQMTGDLQSEPLFSRAWCLQEGLLSPRMLNYTSKEVLWQCETKSLKRAENTHIAYDRVNFFYSNPFRRMPTTKAPSSKESKEDSSTEAPTSIWAAMVENYTYRQISYPADKFLAIAGIAEELQTLMDDQYIAGLWQKHFIELLAWKRAKKPKPWDYSPLSHYRKASYAPTWSWASIDGPVEYDHPIIDLQADLKLKAELMSFNVELERKELPFGRVKPEASITLQASIIPVLDSPGLDEAEDWYTYPNESPTYSIDAKQAADKRGMALPNLTHKQIIHGWFMLLGVGYLWGNKKMKTTSLILMPAADPKSILLNDVQNRKLTAKDRKAGGHFSLNSKIFLQSEDSCWRFCSDPMYVPTVFERIGIHQTTKKGSQKFWKSPTCRRIVTIV